MKVLHVLPFPGVGGTEIATRRIADALRPFGVTSFALLLDATDDLLEYLEDAGVACLEHGPRPEPSLVRNAPRFLLDSVRLARVCAGFDLVHCADVSAAYHVATAGRLAGRPTLCHVRNRTPVLSRRSRTFLGAANHFAFVSEDTRRRFPMPLPQARTSVVYDGIEIRPLASQQVRAAAAAEVKAEFALPADALVAAMFARVNPQKDYATLIRAAALLRDSHPRLHFLIVGDNGSVALNRRHFEEVRAQARSAGVLDRFVFAGFRADIERLMLAADICVLCTHFEGLPLVLIEAMAAGRPCVATAVDGVPETVTHEVTGLLHRHGDAQGLATALARLADAPALAETMGARARLDAQRRFGRERFANDLHALYTRLTAPAAATHLN